jgi:hypothetical protein
MSKFFATLMDAISIRFERLTDREKKLVLSFISFLLVIVIGGGFLWVNHSLDKKRAQMDTLRKQLDEINSLQDQYQQAKMKQEAEERRFKYNTVSLFSFIQSSATRFGLTLYDLNEHKEPVAESTLIETSVVVNLKQVSIDRLTAFLEALEESSENGVVKVTRIKVKSRFDAEDLLDVQMTVATWKSA